MTKLQQIYPAIERVFACDTTVGESPLWDADSGFLHWVDIPSGEVFHGDPRSGRFTVKKFAAPVACLALSNAPRQHQHDHHHRLQQQQQLLVASGDNIEYWSRDLEATNGEIFSTMPVQNSTSDQQALNFRINFRFNDGKAGPDGRFWIGVMDANLGPQAHAYGVARVYGFAKDAPPLMLPTPLQIPNGIAWSPAGDRMVFSDSRQGKVWQVAFDRVEGPVGEPTPWLAWDKPLGMPDGAAMDELGCYWSCGVFGSAIHRFSPQGVHLESYHLPISQPTMCCFGDADMRTLYVTSMTAKMTREQRQQQPLAGSVLAFRVDTPGHTVPFLR